MSYSSNYDKLCGNFILSSPDNLNPLRRTGPGFGSVLYFSNAFVTYSNNVNFQQSRFNSFAPNTLITNTYTFLVCSNADIGSNICFTLSNLMPNMQYSFNVYLTNTCNPGDGFRTSNSLFFTTPFPPPAARLNSVTLYNLEYYPYSGQTCDTRIQINQILRNSSLVATGGICNVLNGGGPLAIINNCNSGQDGGTAGSLAIICGPNTNSINFNGFNLGGFQSPGITTTSNSRIIIGAIQDTYAGVTNLDKFYIQASNVSIIVSCNFLRPSASGYSYTITQTNTGQQPNINCNFGPFYVDSIIGNPSLANVISFNDHKSQSSFVSGILVNSNSNSYQFYFDCLNLGSNFLPYNNFASYKIIGNGASMNNIIMSNDSPIYNINCNIISTAPLPRIIRLSNTVPISLDISENTILHTINTNTMFELNIFLNNIVGTSEINRSLYYYYDTLSLRALRINFSNAFARGGMRIESFSNSYNNTVRAYDQSRFIINASCNLYNFELPLVGGFYRTGANLGVTFNILHNFIQPGGFESYTYPNYAGLAIETGYRVATFKYSFSNSSAGSISALQFNINSNAPFRFTSDSCNFDVNQVPFLRYKVDNVGSYNTGWLDGNSLKSDSTPFSSGNVTDGTAGLLSNSTEYPINGTSRYWSIIPIPTTCNYDIYVKIGLKMSCNLFFNYIYLINTFGVKPLAPINITLTVFTSPTTMILNWVNAYNPGDPSVLNNNISVNNITDTYYPRRWVESGPTASDDIYTATIASNTSNVFTLLNADTIYQANITNENTGGYGPAGTTTGKTDLPIQTLGGFYDSSFSFTNYYNSTVNPYYANCNGYSFVDRAVASNMFYIANLFLLDTDYLQVNMTPSFIVNTSNSTVGLNYPGIYLENFTFAGYGSNNSVVKSSSYRFENFLYSNIDLTSDSGIGDPGVTVMLSNMGDIYIGCNYFSGYFYKSALSLKLENNYLVPLNKPYRVGFSNNYSSNILNPAPIWVDDFQNDLLPTVENMFVDSNNLAALDVNGAPIRFTYSTGVLIFSSRFNPFTVQSNTTYNFWLHAKNIGSNFFINSPYQFSLSQTSGSSNFSFDPATTNFYSSPVFGNTLTDYAQNASSDTFFLFSNAQMKFINSNVFSPLEVTNINMSGSVRNQNGSSSLTSHILRDINNTPLFFDDASLNVLYRTQSAFSSNYTSTPGPNNNYGYRVTSGVYTDFYNIPPFYSGDILMFNDIYTNYSVIITINPEIFTVQFLYDENIIRIRPLDDYVSFPTACSISYEDINPNFEKFNNCNSLIDGTYNSELQLTNGVFTSKSNDISYLKYTDDYYNPIPSIYSYPDYATIVNDSSLRYANFMWYVSADSLNGNTAFIGQINILNNNFTTTILNGFAILNNIKIQYRILGTDYYTSTGWVDANSQYDLYTQGVPSYLYNGDPGGIYDAGTYPTNSSNRYILLQHSYGGGNPDFKLFFRIGIPVNSELFFSGCKLVNISV